MEGERKYTGSVDTILCCEYCSEKDCDGCCEDSVAIMWEKEVTICDVYWYARYIVRCVCEKIKCLCGKVRQSAGDLAKGIREKLAFKKERSCL